jgi:hypothetical protein
MHGIAQRKISSFRHFLILPVVHLNGEWVNNDDSRMSRHRFAEKMTKRRRYLAAKTRLFAIFPRGGSSVRILLIRIADGAAD